MQRWKLMSVFQKGFHVVPWSPIHNRFKDLMKSNLNLYKTFACTTIFINLQIDLIIKRDEIKCPIFSEKYWYYFHCPKNVLRSILSFVFWIFPPSDTAVQLESADSKHNTISKSLFQDSFRHIFWAMRKMHQPFWKKRPLDQIQMHLHRYSCSI